MPRLMYVDLDRLHLGLFLRWVSGSIDVASYCDDWDRLVDAAGWTWGEVLEQIDRSWLSSVVVRPLEVC